MAMLDNLFFKKANNSYEKSEKLPTSEKERLDEAGQMANVVIAGIESENYSDMNLQLSNIVSAKYEKIEYVFEHPSVVRTFIAMTVCVVATLICIYFMFIGLTTSLFSAEYFTIGVTGTVISFVMLFANIFFISKFASVIRYKIRFDIYNELLGFKSLEFVEDLAVCSKQKEPTVIKDLHKAVKQKFIPQGHFNRDNLVFMVSDKIYDKYMEKPAVYDRYFQNKIEERRRVEARTERINQIMEAGEQYIKKLGDYRALIKDKTVSRKIDRLSTVVSMIFHEIDVNPSQAQSLGVFLNYYLPTTEKLIDTYVSITENKICVSNMSTAKKEIEDALNTIIASFEDILEKLYEEYEMDITSDIDAMELVMKKEGLPI